MSELKFCPFCGGKARIVSDYSSEHDKTRWSLWHECCEHEGSGLGYGHALFPWFETPWYDTEEEAVNAWNARAERTCTAIPLEPFVVTLNHLDFTQWCRCSECGSAMPSWSKHCPGCGAKVEGEEE
jgi:hypothetical protein